MVADRSTLINIGEDCTLKARIGWQGLTVDEYRDNGNYLLVTGTDFNNGLVNWDTCHYVDKWRYTQDKNIQLKDGDIVITKDGTIGKIGYVENLKLPATLNSGVFVVRPKNKNIFPKYLYYIFTSEIFNEFLNRLTAGSTINHLYQKDFVSFEFDMPSPQEQKSIAQALSDIDALIASLEKLIGKKEHIKMATMQQLLTGRKRLDGFNGKWEEKTLGELFEFRNGLNKAKEFFGYGTPIVNYMDVFSFYGLKKENILGKVQVTNNEIKSYRVKKGDVFFTRTSETVDEIGLTTVILEDLENTVFSGFILRARPIIDVYELEFKKYCFSGETIRKQIMATSSYTTRALTNGSSLKKVIVSIPPKQEQQAIAQILSDMDNEIETLKTKLKKTKNIKIGMMQELLTGKTRLK